MKLNNKNKGFTLIELLVVIAVIGILSGVVLNSLQSARNKAQNATRLSDIDQISKAFEIYLTRDNVAKLGLSAGLALGNGTRYCLGGTTCSNQFVGTPFNTAAATDATLNTNLAKGFGDSVSRIPTDPKYQGNAIGSTYYYFVRGAVITSPSTTRGNCDAAGTKCPGNSTYLVWLMDKTGLTASTNLNCGRGVLFDNAPTGSATGIANKYVCVLRIGTN